MNFPVFLNKHIIGFKPIQYTPLWWWYRFMSHEGFRLDDRHLIKEFWSSLNAGWEDTEYQHKFEQFWGKGSYPPERIILSQRDYDALIQRLNEPPDPKIQERMKQIMNKPAPWDDDYDTIN